MKIKRVAFVTISLLVPLLLMSMSSQNQPQRVLPEIITGRWEGRDTRFFKGEAIVYFKPTVQFSDIKSHLEAEDLSLMRADPLLPAVLVKLPPQRPTLDEINRLHSIPGFDRVAPSYVMSLLDVTPNEDDPGNPYWEMQYWLENTGQEPPGGDPGSDIYAPEGWALERGATIPGSGSSGLVPVAVLDTGLPLTLVGAQLSHEDLGLNTPWRFEIKANYINEWFWSPGRDWNGHGTCITGILAADTNNETGVAGSSWGVAKAWMYKVADYEGNGRLYDVALAIYQAVNDGARVISASVGSYDEESLLESAVQYAQTNGVIIVAGAGNEANRSDDRGIGQARYPAQYATQYSNVICVGALEKDDHRTIYSNIAPAITVAAMGGRVLEDPQHPGTEYYIIDQWEDLIFTTAPGYDVTIPWLNDDDYGWMFGTSAATPQVSSLVALIYSVNPNLSYHYVIGLIEAGTDKIHSEENDKWRPNYDYDYSGDGRNDLVGFGRINYRKTIESIPITGFEVHVMPKGPGPAKVAVTEAPPSNYYVRLVWDPHYGDAFQCYRVYRSDNVSNNWRVVATVSQSSGGVLQYDDTYRIYDGYTYYYKIRVWGSEPGGSEKDQYAPSNVLSLDIPQGGGPPPRFAINESMSLPSEVTLESNYPNPFNPSTQIKFGLPATSHVRLQIMNIRGQTVRVLVDENKPAGWFTVTWDGKNESGREVASGIYLYIIEADNKKILKRLTLIR